MKQAFLEALREAIVQPLEELGNEASAFVTVASTTLAAVEDTIDNHETRIVIAEGTIGIHTAQIAVLTAEIVALQMQFAALEARVTVIEDHPIFM